MVVGRHVLIVLRLDDLDIGEVADKDGEQRRKGKHGTSQTVGKCHAAEHAGFRRVEQATTHARARGVVAVAVGRHVGKTRTGRGGGCDLVIGDGGHGAGAGELGFASGCLVAGAQQQRDDDKARQQRGAALAHKGQGDAGQRDQAGYAAND